MGDLKRSNEDFLIDSGRDFRINLETRSIYLFSDINEGVAKSCADGIVRMQDSENDIDLFINSPGGHVTSALSMMAFIRDSNPEIVADVTGWACSAAFLILMACQYRRVSKDSILMIHEMSWWSENRFSEQENLIRSYKEWDERIFKGILDSTKLKWADLKKEMQKGDVWITPKEALNYQLIHEVY